MPTHTSPQMRVFWKKKIESAHISEEKMCVSAQILEKFKVEAPGRREVMFDRAEVRSACVAQCARSGKKY